MLTGCEPHRPTGVAVAEDGRVFVSFPFTDYSRPELFTASLVEIVDKGRAQPYPNRFWNRKWCDCC